MTQPTRKRTETATRKRKEMLKILINIKVTFPVRFRKRTPIKPSPNKTHREVKISPRQIKFRSNNRGSNQLWSLILNRRTLIFKYLKMMKWIGTSVRKKALTILQWFQFTFANHWSKPETQISMNSFPRFNFGFSPTIWKSWKKGWKRQ